MNLKEVNQELDQLTHRLNNRPRKTVGFMTPSRKLSGLLQGPLEPATLNASQRHAGLVARRLCPAGARGPGDQVTR